MFDQFVESVIRYFINSFGSGSAIENYLKFTTVEFILASGLGAMVKKLTRGFAHPSS